LQEKRKLQGARKIRRGAKENPSMQPCSWTTGESSITETAKIVCRAIEHGDRQPVRWIAIRSFKKSSSDACAGADGDFAGDLQIVDCG
jgi:hypothetical protein